MNNKNKRHTLLILVILPKNYAKDNGHDSYSEDELVIYDRRTVATLNMSLGRR